MIKGIATACCLLALVFFLNGRSIGGPCDGDAITWLVLDLPPFFLTDGPDKGKGIADQIQRMVSERLTGYRSHTQVANASRIAQELMEEKCVCFAGEFYGNPDFLTSVPTVALFPHTIIVRKEDAHRFGDEKAISLKELLLNQNLILGTAQGRLYGPELDDILKPFGKSRNVYKRSGKDTLDGLLGMLLRGRIDYLIEYPASIQYAAKRVGVTDRIAMIPIRENVNGPLIRGAIRCADTVWGRRTIEEINRVLLELRASSHYRNIIRDWAAPPGKEREYWKIYEEQVLNVTK